MKVIKKKGISLIVLVITIVVIIILAAAVILTLGTNNPINSSKKAAIVSDVDNFKSEFSMNLSTAYLKNIGSFEISSLKDDKMAELVPTLVSKKIESKNYSDVLTIEGGKLAIKSVEAVEGLSQNTIEALESVLDYFKGSSGDDTPSTPDNGGTPTTPGSDAPTTNPAVDRDYKMGDLVAIGNQEFRVLKDSDPSEANITLIAKGVLESNPSKADSELVQVDNSGCEYGYWSCSQEINTYFSKEVYWQNEWDKGSWSWDTFDLLDLNNVTGYQPGDAISKAKAYASSLKTASGKNAGATGRLLTVKEYEEIVGVWWDLATSIREYKLGEQVTNLKFMLFCQLPYYDDDGNFDGFIGGSGACYWLSNVSHEEADGMFTVYSDDERISYSSNYNESEYNAVRPVINVPKTSLNP